MTDSIHRRDFLKTAGAQAGLLAVGTTSLGAATPEPVAPAAGRWLAAPAINGKTYDVAVIGAGAFGGWTAYWARKLGASVVLIDAYGPGNSRSPSGGAACAVPTAIARRHRASSGCSGPIAPSSDGKRGMTSGGATSRCASSSPPGISPSATSGRISRRRPAICS